MGARDIAEGGADAKRHNPREEQGVNNHVSTEYITTGALSDRTGLPMAWLRREAEAGRIPSLLVGRSRRFLLDSVLSALSKMENEKRERPESKRQNPEETRLKKMARAAFAREASLRIDTLVSGAVRKGRRPSDDEIRELWKAEAEEAKRRGLYSKTTYNMDIARYLRNVAESPVNHQPQEPHK